MRKIAMILAMAFAFAAFLPAQAARTGSVTGLSNSCEVITQLPYSEGFENFNPADTELGNRTAPLCWVNIDGGSANFYFGENTDNSYAASGNGSLKYTGVASTSAQGATSDWIISPAFQLSGNEQVGFKLRNLSFNHYYPNVQIDVLALDIDNGDMLSAADTSLFTLIGTVNHSSTGSLYSEYNVSLVGYNGATRLAFAVRTPSQSFFIDDVSVSTMPECPDVLDVEANIVSSTSVEISFSTLNSRQNGWVIAYGQAPEQGNFDPQTATTIMLEANTTLPYLINNLTAGETYFFAVKQNCNGGEYSEAVSVSLPESVFSLPYEEDFSNPNSVTGWSLIASENEQSHGWVIGSAVDNPSSSSSTSGTAGALYVSTDGGTNNNYHNSPSATTDAYIYINFTPAAGYTLSFDWKAAGEENYDYLRVHLVPLSESPSYSNAVTDLLSGSANTWEHVSLQLPSSYAGGIYKLLFRWTNDHSMGDPPAAAVDNLKIEGVSCGAISSVNAQFVEATNQETTPSISVTIEDNNSNVIYLLQYRADSQTEWTSVEDLTFASFPYSIEDISYSTLYHIQVAVVCPDGVTTPFVSSQVQTPCGVLTTPWEENFNTNPLTLGCWEKKNGLLPESGYIESSELISETSYGWSHRTSPMPSGEGGCMRITVEGTGLNRWLVTPSIRLSEGATYQLSFAASLVDLFTGGEPTYYDDDKFAILVSLDGGETWSAANGLVFKNNDADTLHNLSSLSRTPQTFTFELRDALGNPINGTVKFAFYAESSVYNGSNYLYIDNIEVNEATDCQTPQNIAVNDITASTATISFTSVTQSSQWEYALVEGDNPSVEQGITVAFDSEDLPLVLQGLAESTTYAIALRSICAEGDASPWSDFVSFTTQDLPTSLPFVSDFGDDEDNNRWSMFDNGTINKWAIGSATNVGNDDGGKAAYISNDNGVTYAASQTVSTSSAFIYRDFDFGEDASAVYALNFDWKTSGLGDEYFQLGAMEVYLAEPNSLNETTTPSESDRIAVLLGSNDWTHYSTELTGVTGIKRLAFRSYGYFEQEEFVAPSAIDNIEILTGGCNTPENVTVSNITSSSADIAWQGSSESYTVSYRSSLETEYTSLTTTQPNITLSNLNSATIYSFTVMAICGEDESAPSAEQTFQTPCNSSTITSFPYLESFEIGLDCWTVEHISGTQQWIQRSDLRNGQGDYIETAAGAGNYFAAVRLPEEGTTTRLISPIFDLSSLTNPSVSFLRLALSFTDYYPAEPVVDEMKVYYRATPSEAWTQIAHYTEAAETWQTESLALPNASTTYQIAFEVVGNYANGVGLDNVTLYDAPNTEPELPCDTPTNLTVSNITATSADMAWNGTAEVYEIRLNGAEAEEIDLTATTYNNLTPDTDYTFEVRAVCENGFTDWVAYQFRTLAESVEIVVGEVITQESTNITATSATLHGNIVSRGNSTDYITGFEIAATESELGNGLTLPATENGDSFSGELADMPAGIYYYRAFLLNEAGFAYGEAKTVTLSSSLSEIEGAIRFALYPNPASERVTLNIKGLNQEAQIVVSDAQGRVLFTDTLNAGAQTYELNTENYAGGVYYIRLIGSNGVSTQKLIVR